MGSTESTGRSNRTEEEEDQERQPENDMGARTAVAITAAGTVIAAWGVSRMISVGKRLNQREKDDAVKIKAHGGKSSSTGGKSTWSRPPVGRFKMNTDGGCPYPMIQADGVERGHAGYAGILRNDRGMWVRGFQGSFNGETKDSLTAELHGIHKGLKLLDKLKLKGSILESDNQAAVDWVNRQNNYRGNSPIINGCWDIIIESRQLKLKNDVAVVHIIGDNANQCAGNLADIAANKQGPYVEIIDLPYDINHLVDKDMKS